jgi:hypothetical protein
MVRQMFKRGVDIVNAIRNYMENSWPEESRYINEMKKFILYELFGKEEIVEISNLDVILSEPNSPRSLQLRAAYRERRRQRLEKVKRRAYALIMENFDPLDHLNEYGELLYISKIFGGKFDYSETIPCTEISGGKVSINFTTDLFDLDTGKEKVEKTVRIWKDFSSLTLLQELIKNDELTVKYRFPRPKSFSDSFFKYSKKTTLQQLEKTKNELKSTAIIDLMRLLENSEIYITFESRFGQNALGILGTISPSIDLKLVMLLKDYSPESEKLLRKILGKVN